MANVFAKQGVLFVPVPAIALDLWRELPECERSLYLCLLRFAQKHSAIELHVPAYLIHDYTGLHAETVAVARRGLEKRNWIRCSKGANGIIVYRLLNPNTGTVLPAPTAGDKKFSGIFIHKSKGRSARTVRSTAKVLPGEGLFGRFDIPWDEIGGKSLTAQPSPKLVPVDGSAVSTSRPSRHRAFQKRMKTQVLGSVLRRALKNL